MPLLAHAVTPPMASPYAQCRRPIGVMRESLTKAKPADEEGPSPKGEGAPTCKYPTVRLDLDFITDEVAARLATSLLGHVLFLKSQVPLPVGQLSRIPSAKSSARAIKQRNDLLQSFDTLSSHLITTFTTLSTALARCSSNPNKPKSDAKGSANLTWWEKNCERVFLAILVGPSTGSTRAKVVFGVDGLETKVWGLRDDVKCSTGLEEEDEVDEGEEEEDEDEDESEDASGSSNGHEDSDEECFSAGESPPPLSRSPTPEIEPSPPPYTTHAEQQHALHLAERLLARALAAADADGNSMAAEIAPTQTHILLRAPRRFQHPAWIPRQNISTLMDNTLDEFLEESGLLKRDADTPLRKKRKTQKGKVEGVWITCRDGFREADSDEWKVGDDEGDEMIWWGWDGKLLGFSEW